MITEEFELVVIGAGPAGMEAAIVASEAGVSAAVIESLPEAGGQYFRKSPPGFTTLKTTAVEDQGNMLSHRLGSSPATSYFGTLAWGLFRGESGREWLVALEGPDAPRWMRASTLVLANGAHDTPVAFPGWTLPGVITCGAALILAKSQHIAPGKRALITGTGPLLLSTAAHLAEIGVDIAAICDSSLLSPKALFSVASLVSQPSARHEAWGYLGHLVRRRIAYKTGWSILEAIGKDHVEEVVIGRVDGQGYPISGRERKLNVDTVVSGYGLTPNVRLARMIGCELDFQPKDGGWVPVRDQALQTSLPGVYVVGDAAAIRGAENARLEGRWAGISVARQMGHLSDQQAAEKLALISPGLVRQRRWASSLSNLFPQRPGWQALATDETVLCRCEEVSLGEVKAAVQEGAGSLDVVKMVTRAGMGDCQGRMCERSVCSAMLCAMGSNDRSVNLTGLYSVRPPLHPLALGSLAEAALDE